VVGRERKGRIGRLIPERLGCLRHFHRLTEQAARPELRCRSIRGAGERASVSSKELFGSVGVWV